MTQDNDSTLIKRDEFGAQETRVATGTADAAVAAQMQAQVQARYIMAMRRPRSWNAVRQQVLHECKRSRFAESAWYRKPIGGGKTVDGFSIRFAEMALRNMTNMAPEVITTYDDARKKIIRVQLSDLEANLTYSTDITIEKSVERRNVRPGQTVLGKRTNSTGQIVFLVEASEADLVNKENANVSKTLRNLVLRMLPGDIQDEAREQIQDTLSSSVDKDPDAARKALMDGFSSINVGVRQLEEYLGHDVNTVSNKEVLELRQVFRAVHDGETTWHETMEGRRPSAEPEKGSKKDSLMAKIDSKIVDPKPDVKAPAVKPDKSSDDDFADALKRAADRGAP